VRRRAFITLLGGAAAWSVAARAQQGERVRRIGILNPFADDDLEVQANIVAFRQTLQKLGWTDGRNVRIDYRWSGVNPARILEHVKELVGLNPDVILGVSPLALQPLLQETSSIPIARADEVIE
jgi:putative ABC transport system substrate-binding protein